MAKLEIVGIGPGSPDYVTPAARKSVRHSQLVIGAQRSLNLFPNDIKGETRVLTAKNLNETLKHASDSVINGKKVALLSTGDPGFSGLLHTVLESGFFKPDQIIVVPGVSSIQACAARLNIGWDNTRLFTFHDEVSGDDKEKLVSAVKCGRTILLLPNSREFAPKNIASLLIDQGIDKATPVYICENVTLENENIISSTLGKVSARTFDSLCVMVIKQTT